jgi:Mrp family chromosome partitioning ATPase
MLQQQFEYKYIPHCKIKKRKKRMKRHVNGVSRIIVVASGKGGVGKSTVAANSTLILLCLILRFLLGLHQSICVLILMLKIG